jgi:hypothetical protein
VFTNEVDQSFLAGGVAQIGAAIVGTTVKGPALVPTPITSMGDFEEVFGSFTDESYVPLVVNDYLRNGNVITVTRLLYEDGYSLSNGVLAIVAKSASVEVVTNVLHPTQAVTTDGATNLFESSVFNDGGSGSFEFKYSGSFVAGVDSAIGFDGSFLVAEGASISGSIVSTDNNHVNKVFGQSPKSTDYPVFVQYGNKNASTLFSNLAYVTMSLEKVASFALAQDFQTAATPFITSQKIGTLTKNLLKFHTLAHGTSVNHEVKIGIRDIKLASEVSDPNGYGTFTVEVRRVNTTNIPGSPYDSDDTDKVPELVETFRNVNLDPDSPRFVSRVIGDRFTTVTNDGDLRINGDYPNLSKYIRVEVTDAVANGAENEELIPFGFAALNSPIPMVSSSLNLTAASYVTSQTPSGQAYSSKNYYGFDYTNLNNLNYLAPIPTTSSTTGSNTAFYLGDQSQDSGAAFPTLLTAYSGSIQTVLDAGTLNANIALSTRKFMVPMQGGFDGAKPNLKKYSGTNISAANTFGHDCSGTATGGTKAYKKAFDLLENSDFFDINLLLTPGIIDSLHPLVTTDARNLVEERQDTFYVMDTNALTDSLDTVVNQVTSIDNNYTAAYFPWVRVIDPSKNKPIYVPPSVVVPGALAFNDAISAPWFAPAGLNRGGLDTTIGTYINLSQKQRDKLYEARVNPIANFPNEGVCIWGQKTLQGKASALDRVNVRRLLIAVKKFIASATKFLVFEQNTSATRSRFLGIVNPYLDQVKAQQGLSAFNVVMDDTNNTPDLIDQNILYGQIFLQPTRTAEFIILDFNIQPTGASFPE